MSGGSGKADVQELNAAGFRGIRLNPLHDASRQVDGLETLCRLVAPLGRHLELAVRPQTLGEISRRLWSANAPIAWYGAAIGRTRGGI